MIDEEVEEFLEHFGIKGMHWGHRKQRTPSEKDKIKARNKGIAIGVVASGAVFAAFLINKKMKGTSITEVRKANKIQQARRGVEIAKLIRNFDKVEVKSLPELPKHNRLWKINEMNNMRKNLKNIKFT